MGHSRAQALVDYMKEGFYIDTQTKDIDIQVLTYNANLRLFCVVRLDVHFELGGQMRMRYDIQTISVEHYHAGYTGRRLAAEVLVMLIVFGNFITEFVDLRRKGWDYFESVWNYIDLLNLGLFVSAMVTWIYYQQLASAFKPQHRFDVYQSLASEANFLNPKENEFGRMVSMFHDARTLSEVMSSYLIVNSVIFVCMLIRLLKMLDFQERIGLVTRTIKRASTDLLHFAVLFSLIFLGYAALAHLFFGNAILPFSTFGRAVNTCFEALLGEISVTQELYNLPNAFAAVVFFYSYILLMFFILLNVLLAIIVDAYEEVKRESADARSIHEEIVMMWHAAMPVGFLQSTVSD